MMEEIWPAVDFGAPMAVVAVTTDVFASWLEADEKEEMEEGAGDAIRWM